MFIHDIKILLAITSLLVTSLCSAQNTETPILNTNQITYWSPVMVDGTTLVVKHDARSVGMGEVGITTSPDAYSIAHNMSKMGFLDKSWGVSISYVPWMSTVVRDMNMASLAGFYSFKDKANRRHTFNSSLKYFYIGATQAIPKDGTDVSTVFPYEFAVDLGYAYRLHKNWSVGVALRYLISDYNFSISGVSSKASSLLFDLSGTYTTPVTIAQTPCDLTAAIAVNNIGGKMTHDGGATYLFTPATFRLGVGMTSQFSTLSKIGVHLEMDKLLVPTYPSPDAPNYEKSVAQYYATNPFSALFTSWADAPGGAAEEFKEIAWSLGAEYTYADKLMARMGYRFQHLSKGMGQGLSLGLGFKYSMAQLDASYFISTVANSPLNNTLRLSLGIEF